MVVDAEGPPTKRDEWIEVANDGRVSVLRLAGELDMANADAVRDRAARVLEERTEVVLDLSGVRFIDSSGVRAILSVMAAGEASDRRVRLVPGPPQVDRVFAMLGLKDRLDWVGSPTLPEAPSDVSGFGSARCRGLEG